MRSLARVLGAVQRLVDQRDEVEQDDPGREAGEDVESAVVLHLINVKASSAAYAVSAPDGDLALKVLSEFGDSIGNPSDADWLDSTLSSVREIGEVAKSLGCEIEFRRAPNGGRLGDVIAKITPITYGTIRQSAYVHGRTSTYAKIERVGGATDMHCGIRLPAAPRKMVICAVKGEALVRELGQLMYQHVMLHGNATWIRHNWRLKRMVIDSFDPPKTGSIMGALEKAHEAGGYAWDSIADPQGIIEEMRG